MNGVSRLREPMISGDEIDALTRSRRLYAWQPGALRKTKARFNRRVRRKSKARIAAEQDA
jgi:hypothetical protein